MSEEWTAIAAEAAEAIADNGFDVTFTRVTAPQSPLDTVPPIPTETTVKAVQTKTSRAFMSNGSEVIVAKTLLVDAAYEPKQGDWMVIGTDTDATPVFSVVRVNGLAPGGVDIMFKVDLAT